MISVILSPPEMFTNSQKRTEICENKVQWFGVNFDYR